MWPKRTTAQANILTTKYMRKFALDRAVQIMTLVVFGLLSSPSQSLADSLIEADRDFELLNYSKAISTYKELAANGNARAELRIAEMYRDGLGVAQDIDASVRWLQQSAKHGNSKAQGDLGGIYAVGKLLPRDLKKAFFLIEMAAKAGDIVAQVDLGWAYMSDYLEMPPNYKLAMEWSLKAANQGEGEGASNVGLLYENGWGVPVNYSEAAKWYKKAIEYGATSAQAAFHLADLYEKGKGVEVDIEKAKVFFQYAIDSRDDEYMDQAIIRLRFIQDAPRLKELDDVKYPEQMPRRNKIPHYRHFDING